ncbi:MAG: hypothetical protein M0C28_33565 [Candidatus Moduliflexus flocculans]|nr:hypothetical protein [Candidatus Moduliflexus flocculans]
MTLELLAKFIGARGGRHHGSHPRPRPAPRRPCLPHHRRPIRSRADLLRHSGTHPRKPALGNPGQDYTVEETSCKAKGESACEFTITRREITSAP